MPKRVKSTKIDTPTARGKLPVAKKPTYRSLETGVFLGYRRGKDERRWVARVYLGEGAYTVEVIGDADDADVPATSETLDFKRARDKTLAVAERLRRTAKSGPYTVSDALDDYMTGFQGKSVAATRSRADSIIKPALGHHEVSKLTTKMIGDWLIARGKSPAKLRTGKKAEVTNERPAETDEALRRRRSTANRDLTVLKAALNVAFRAGKIASDEAWRRVSPFKKADRAKLRYLSDAESRRLVNACDASIRPLVMAALLTGARYAELTGLEARDFDRQAQTLWLRETKAGIARPVYLEAEGVRLLNQHTHGKTPEALIFPRPDGYRWNASQQTRPLAAACKAAKIESTGFHDLRRTYGARLALRGVPMAVIAEALGHADERITRRHYAHLSPSYLSSTIRENAAGLGIVEESNVVRIETA